MNRYTRNKNGSIDGPGGLVYEIRIQANEVIFDGGTASEGVRVKIPIENIYQLDLLEHKEAVGILYKLLGGIAATGAAAITWLLCCLSCPFIYIQDGDVERFMGEFFSGAVTENMARHDSCRSLDLNRSMAFMNCGLPMRWRSANTGSRRSRGGRAPSRHGGVDDARRHAHPDRVTAVACRGGDGPGDNCEAVAARATIAYDFTDECAEKESFSSLSLAFDKPAGVDQAHVILHVKNTMWSMMMYESFMSMFGSRYDDYVEHQRDRSAEQKTQWLKDQGQMLEVQLRRSGQWETVHWVNLPGPFSSEARWCLWTFRIQMEGLLSSAW